MYTSESYLDYVKSQKNIDPHNRDDLVHEKWWQNIIYGFAGSPVQVDINMYVRSMGPISEMDMVSINQLIQFSTSNKISNTVFVVDITMIDAYWTLWPKQERHLIKFNLSPNSKLNLLKTNQWLNFND